MNNKHPSQDPRLFRFLDCIHYSKIILMDQHKQLNQIIDELVPTNSDLIIRCISISWAIVDSIHRIREVAQNIPGLSAKNENLKSFLNNTHIVEDFRHYIQHLRSELAKTTLDNFPVWGSFSWVDNKDNTVSNTAVTGTVICEISCYSSVYDTVAQKWVSRSTLSIQSYSFNIDICFEQTINFCDFILDLIKELKEGQFSEQTKIPVYSVKFCMRQDA